MVRGITGKINNVIADVKLPKAQKKIEKRRIERKNQNKKINVIFVCHRPAVWGALKTVYDACMEDKKFNVAIVTIPNKKELPGKGFSHNEYVSEGAYEYFKGYKCKLINGYDFDTKKWFDLRRLRPDYIFFQTPYDICRPNAYKSNRVASYAKICYVHYGMPFMNGYIAEESFPVSFLKNTYFHFAEFEEMRKFYADRLPDNSVHKKSRVILTGYPKLDEAKDYIGCEGKNWIYRGEEKHFRIMWTPRWNTEEGNCTFFTFKDWLPDYIEADNNLELLYRPHPQADIEFISRGIMTEAEIKKYRGRFINSNNMSIDERKDYLDSFYSSDVLITDESSIIPEYFLTGKPIIFTYNETHLNDFAKKISEGFYWAKNKDELKEHLDRLKSGQDELKDRRQQLIREEFYLPEKGSGYEIKEIIKADFR
ncbi:MAG: CDP-glycerol glycerophosphotransferase family protein [Lachnospiraceae bacterium]|nr:CDP-glycerol glycerophosphotransferase family protein [Lachnospiraceae bacterium]